MIPVKTRPKFRCEFCKKKAVHHRMERHERICYYNKNRVCEKCNNTGSYNETRYDMEGNENGTEKTNCEACVLFKQLNDRGETKEKVEHVDPEEIPF